MLFDSISKINIQTPLVTIRPYVDSDFDNLNHSFDKNLFKWFIRDYTDFADYITEKNNECSHRNLIPLTICDNKGRPLGITCLYSFDDKHNSLEVGSTWIAKKYQGTGYNLIFKYYLFKTLIEEFKLNRVQLKADADNLKSIGSMKSVGLNYEGKLLSHMIVQCGRVRDSEVFSATKSTWHDMKNKMITKLDKNFLDIKW